MDSVTGVFIEIHKEGDGYKTFSGIDITLNFQGWTLDGAEFVDNFSQSPREITLGETSTYPDGQTPGVGIGISLMNEGDSATIYAPSPYGYQDNAYENVPPNSILVYNIKFEDIVRLSEDYEKIDQYIADNNIPAEIESNYGIRYAIHREGNGVSPVPGATISTQYIGELLDGTVFDSSYDSGFPLNFTFGNGELIVGFELGISQLHEEDSATIFIPSIYGYGGVAQGEIPANSVLIFGLDILSVTNPN
jgi:FKBP-type peptidyl-prolyl cis-trans isomerase FkpA